MTAHLGKSLSIVSAALLALSVIYDYFFLRSLGLSFAEVPTTISDHLRSAVIWLPVLGIFGFVGFVLGASREPKNAAAQRKFNQLDLFVFANLGLVLAITVWTASTIAVMLDVLLTLGLAYFRFQPGFTYLQERVGFWPAQLLLATLPVIALVGTKGYSAGASMMSSSKPEWRAVIKTGNAENTVDLVGIRRFATSVVLVKSKTSVMVVGPDSIVSVLSLKEPQQKFRCWVNSSLCTL